jgi:hypothetical protein
MAWDLLGDGKKTEEPMPVPQDIEKKVIHNVAVVSGFDESGITRRLRLAEDLGFTDDMQGALAPGFKKIARAYKPAATVTKAACKELGTVGDCIDLVVAAAGVNS